MPAPALAGRERRSRQRPHDVAERGAERVETIGGTYGASEFVALTSQITLRPHLQHLGTGRVQSRFIDFAKFAAFIAPDDQIGVFCLFAAEALGLDSSIVSKASSQPAVSISSTAMPASENDLVR